MSSGGLATQTAPPASTIAPGPFPTAVVRTGRLVSAAMRISSPALGAGHPDCISAGSDVGQRLAELDLRGHDGAARVDTANGSVACVGHPDRTGAGGDRDRSLTHAHAGDDGARARADLGDRPAPGIRDPHPVARRDDRRRAALDLDAIDGATAHFVEPQHAIVGGVRRPQRTGCGRERCRRAARVCLCDGRAARAVDEDDGVRVYVGRAQDGGVRAVAQGDRSDGGRDRERAREPGESETATPRRGPTRERRRRLGGRRGRRIADLRLRGRSRRDLDQNRSPAGRRQLERVVLAQHRLLEVAQLLAGLQPELAHEVLTRLAIRGQRVGLPPSAVEREHELTAQPLAQRVLRDESL